MAASILFRTDFNAAKSGVLEDGVCSLSMFELKSHFGAIYNF